MGRPLGLQLRAQQMGVVKSGSSCQHFPPLIGNILLTTWRCVGALLPEISPFDLAFLFDLPPENSIQLDPL